ncbi:MAG: glycerophosphodiester phosphodiesterase [Alphaproteobacteria bacterium]|nr:glycerophosphodiester phosphodiesterase [Alphaproteobacteria bacterium]
MLALVVSLMIVGHRGASGHAPENTLPAFTKAIELRADAVELDIHSDKDGVPVVVHDGNLKRTANRDVAVSALSAEELAEYAIPSYEQVLDISKDKLVVFTELKGDSEDAVADIITRKVAEEGWTYEQLPVIGFDHEQLKRVKARNPDILIGATFSRSMLEQIPRDTHADFMISAAKAIGASAINPDFRLVNGDVVRKAHKAGLKVNVWTVNAPRDITTMIAFKVDAIMSDYPDRVYSRVHDK